jgi:Protein of unknown function (DUF429)
VALTPKDAARRSRPIHLPRIATIYGVDFSGAAQAGRTTWIAQLVPCENNSRLAVVDLHRLARRCGSSERDAALAALREHIQSSHRALWAMDFPFGLPVELFPASTAWPEQLTQLTAWRRGAYAYGLECVRRAKRLRGAMHVRRVTDFEARTPFDCYHYRIVYQMFHGMRDVLAPLAGTPGTAILPFQYQALPRARRVLVESCPSSSLKRWRLPHQNYKQPGGRPPDELRRRTRRAILAGLRPHVELSRWRRKIVMDDGGGDALDSIVAAVGGWQAFRAADHAAIARHPRHPREGYILA